MRLRYDDDAPIHFDVRGGFPLCGDYDSVGRLPWTASITIHDHLTTCKRCLRRMPDLAFWRRYYGHDPLSGPQPPEMVAEMLRLKEKYGEA